MLLNPIPSEKYSYYNFVLNVYFHFGTSARESNSYKKKECEKTS